MDKISIHFRDMNFFIQLFEGEVYAVGGSVRDIIGESFSEDKEIDLIIFHHTVDDIVKKLEPYGKVNYVGKSFGIIKFTTEGRTYDIALPRKDIPKEADIRSHKDFIISTDPNLPIERDLERRDFRCNSMAARLQDGKLFDPFNGRKDIAEKKIRLTNSEAFPDDPLRIIRAARFASVLGYELDRGVYPAAKAVDLTGLSVERINEELFKILLDSPLPSVGLEELFMLGALRQLYPELYELTLAIQDSQFHPEKDRYGHHSVWQHTKITVDQTVRLVKIFNLEKRATLALLLAALFHDIGKPETAHWEFKKGRMVITNNGHDIASEKIAKNIFDRYKIFSWDGYDLRNTALSLIRCHHRPSELWQNRETVTKKAFNRLAADVRGEIELMVLLDVADRAGRSEIPLTNLDDQGSWLLNKFEELNVNKESIKPLIMGRDLIKLGVSPGPHMGKILKHLYQLQLDSEFETKKRGLELAKEILKKKKVA